MPPDPKIEVTVYIPDRDMQKWLAFQEYYEAFSVLVASDVFKQKNAAVTLNFDHEGVLRTIQRFDVLYNKKHS